MRNAPAAPARSTATSSMLCPPTNIDPITASAFAPLFAPCLPGCNPRLGTTCRASREVAAFANLVLVPGALWPQDKASQTSTVLPEMLSIRLPAVCSTLPVTNFRNGSSGSKPVGCRMRV